ncbi:hypothetical protein TIFTF001_027027 [Ficus carica]|uniref:CLAVATA3/ESR (CLE)-related protein 13 n=1 Tax=Ficus carica TaxID=3494 RepID=A0AA88DM75_FICCA|nr:hypothetical protein TIFTF001_027027 [Ficus carica]
MVVKLSHIISLSLCLSFFFLFVFSHVGWFNFNAKSSTSLKNTNFSSDLPRLSMIIRSRKLATKIDFTPFLVRHQHRHHHHRHHHHRHAPTQPDPGGSEIDPRYGVEKRLVPTGPNPLHH